MCDAECPNYRREKNEAKYMRNGPLFGDRLGSLHGCNARLIHTHHHCGGCGLEWDEDRRASKRLEKVLVAQ